SSGRRVSWKARGVAQIVGAARGIVVTEGARTAPPARGSAQIGGAPGVIGGHRLRGWRPWLFGSRSFIRRAPSDVGAGLSPVRHDVVLAVVVGASGVL